MNKIFKTLIAVAAAGALTLGGATAANAYDPLPQIPAPIQIDNCGPELWYDVANVWDLDLPEHTSATLTRQKATATKPETYTWTAKTEYGYEYEAGAQTKFVYPAFTNVPCE